MRKIFNYLKKIESWLLPYTCLLCKKPTQQRLDLCAQCLTVLPLLKNSCPNCAHPLTHTDCLSCNNQPLPFDTIHALYLYQMPIVQWVLELKFKHALVNARVLGELLAKPIQDSWYTEKPLPDIIIPVPLHTARLKERGFNQALEIARPIAKAIKRPIHSHAAYRVKATAAQATLNAIERHQNIQQAFVIHEDLANQHVAVIDDVITTGETITEFCKTLKQSGVRRIDVWCCARASK